MMMDPLWLWNPWAESTKVQNREYQWLVTQKIKKINKIEKDTIL